MRSPLVLRAIVAAALLPPVLLLAGCGGDDADPEADEVPSAVATPSTATTPSESTSPGRVQVTGELPAGFPVDEVPLYDAPVIAGSAGEDGSRSSWSVALGPDSGTPVDLADAAVDLLTGAGFDVVVASDEDNLQVLRFTKKGYRVGLAVVENNDGITMTYTVVKG